MLVNHDASRFRFPRLARFAGIFAGIVLGFMVCRAVFISHTVQDNSMLPGLKKGTTVYILKHVTPGPGDVVLIDSPAEPGRVLLKRCIAGGGDVVEIRNRVVYVNNRKIDFNWQTISNDPRVLPMNFTTRDTMPAVKLDSSQIFVLGDNLDYSFDSRAFGPVSKKAVIGRLVYKL